MQSIFVGFIFKEYLYVMLDMEYSYLYMAHKYHITNNFQGRGIFICGASIPYHE
jgi:hypothetical protein